jgi:CubicO group peptidase (beta-lactamase class C family)
MVLPKAIKGRMAPGMQVLVARRGKVVFQKSYGTHTYDADVKVSNTDLYDVADKDFVDFAQRHAAI